MLLNNIKKIREDELHMNLRDFAKLTGVCKSTISNLENGHTYVSHKNMILICIGINKEINKEIYEIFNLDWRHIRF